MRLIDADELIEHAWRDKLDSRELIAKMIEQAPTIKEIPTNIPIDIFEKLIQEPKIGQWIPVSERFPEENGYYLTTTMYHEVYCDYWEEERFNRTEAVIAWMPLPEPYKAESEET